MVKRNTIKNKILASALALTMVCSTVSLTAVNSYAADNYGETIKVPEGIADGTYYGIQEVANVMPGVGDDHHPFSYLIEVAVTVENEKITDVRVSHVDQSTARTLDVDYMNWAVSDLEPIKGIGTEGKTVVTGVDSVTGATKSNLGIFRAVNDALETKSTEAAFGTVEVADNAVTADDADYPAEGEAAVIKLNFDSSITTPESFEIYNDGVAESQYGGIRYNQGEILNSKNGATGTLADADYDYDKETQTLKIYNTSTTGIGSYTINMYDANGVYEDVDVNFCLNDNSVNASDINIDGNVVSIASDKNVALDELLKRVQSVEINGGEYVTYTSNHGIYQTKSPGTAVVGENGVINLSANVNPVVGITEKNYNVVRGKNASNPLENENKAGYNVKLNIAGYPDVEGTIINNGIAEVTFAAEEDDLTQYYEDEKGGAFIPEITATNNKYKLSSSNTAVAKVRAKNNAVTLKGSGQTTLTVTSTDPTYVVNTAKADLTVIAPEGSVSYSDGKVAIDKEKCGTSFSNYLNNATIKITDPDEKTSSYDASSVVDPQTGEINLNAAVRSGKKSVSVFPAYGEYSFVISYGGFEDVKGTVVKEKKDQTIVTEKEKYSKVYGNKNFNINATAEENAALTYASNNEKVAVVNEAGEVDVKAVGTAVITISSAETDNYKASVKKITVNVAKASQTITIKNASKTIKASAVKKSSKTYSFTTTGKKTTLKTSALTKTQKKAISKVSVSGNSVKVKVKKAAKKGTYKIKVYAASSTNYKASASKTITIKIK